MHIILLCRSLKALWGYFKRININNVNVWESIKDLVVKAIIAWVYLTLEGMQMPHPQLDTAFS